MNIVIIGTGNVARQLGQALPSAGHRVLQVCGRTEASAAAVADLLSCGFTLSPRKTDPAADILLIAVPDKAIARVAGKLRPGGALVLHTSGSVSIDVLQETAEQCGVLYPVQTIVSGTPVDFRRVPFCIEARHPEARRRLEAFAHSISPLVYDMDSDRRAVVHLAAVFANNFTNRLFVMASELLAKEQLPFDLLRPLIAQTLQQLQEHPPAGLQTGPARRGDRLVIRKHLALLQDMPSYRKAYKLMTDLIVASNASPGERNG